VKEGDSALSIEICIVVKSLVRPIHWYVLVRGMVGYKRLGMD